MYEYRAMVVDVYDGDTVTVNIDLGFNLWHMRRKVRLAGIDAPELRDKGGQAAKLFLEDFLLYRNITLRTERDKTGKYGRIIGTLLLGDRNINDLLVEHGHAIRKEYP